MRCSTITTPDIFSAWSIILTTARELSRPPLAYYQHTLTQFCQQGIISGCLTVKLSAEVCDLSEDMRTAMDKGASQIIVLLGDALEKGRQEGSLAFEGDALTLSQVLYSLWLGANLQAKITRSATPLESALAHAKRIIAAPAV